MFETTVWLKIIFVSRELVRKIEDDPKCVKD